MKVRLRILKKKKDFQAHFPFSVLLGDCLFVLKGDASTTLFCSLLDEGISFLMFPE